MIDTDTKSFQPFTQTLQNNKSSRYQEIIKNSFMKVSEHCKCDSTDDTTVH